MPEAQGGLRRCCAGCRKPLREGVHFCTHCGRTADGTAGAAAESAIAAEPAPHPAPASNRLNSVFDARWLEIKQVGWLFGLLLASSFIAGTVVRFIKSPWVTAAVSGADALLVMTFAGIHFSDLGPLLGRPTLDRRGVLTLTLLSFAFMTVMCVYFMVISWAGAPLLGVAGPYEK